MILYVQLTPSGTYHETAGETTLCGRPLTLDAEESFDAPRSLCRRCAAIRERREAIIAGGAETRRAMEQMRREREEQQRMAEEMRQREVKEAALQLVAEMAPGLRKLLEAA